MSACRDKEQITSIVTPKEQNHQHNNRNRARPKRSRGQQSQPWEAINVHNGRKAAECSWTVTPTTSWVPRTAEASGVWTKRLLPHRFGPFDSVAQLFKVLE